MELYLFLSHPKQFFVFWCDEKRAKATIRVIVNAHPINATTVVSPMDIDSAETRLEILLLIRRPHSPCSNMPDGSKAMRVSRTVDNNAWVKVHS